ncbi:hypothetical protein COLO4_10496 [Corchorus olitorius]|uniref:Uncharacterized protein n=1 Tax=Corchorus olitorius TaxID=93759 RepID=A0A1R3K8B6_9ROSI|nr:hypothetical protein COLO4_10496 [Corchorus olitorius]
MKPVYGDKVKEDMIPGISIYDEETQSRNHLILKEVEATLMGSQ